MNSGPLSLRQACHDLSQPLMAARGSLELALQLDAQDPGRAEFLADAVAALDRMVAMIERFREMAPAMQAKQ
ncbi:MAG TPA: histidine kinase dimerization/phospho-acceptor domain-containing protein [Terriglobales bacterium]|nr:histidine kinase dimerization/phospho-acceptor domain-containing protein [Terriglobales bacterium]